MVGKWWLGSRGTNPRSWDQWSWTRLDDASDHGPSLDVLAKMAKWAAMGQHVRLEFVPDNVVGDQGA